MEMLMKIMNIRKEMRFSAMKRKLIRYQTDMREKKAKNSSNMVMIIDMYSQKWL
jgi:hypothetical protein